MRRVLFVLCLLTFPVGAAEVTLLHFSDYHSHALPFYTDSGERGGIARAIGYLESEKRRGALVFSGGDTINKGAPAWSDKYTCAEWPWFNGIVDAMAFGNHEPDYGREAFERCRASARYPILSANVEGFAPYAVFERNGIRIGVFAVAGRDFAQLVKVPGFSFGDPIVAARAAVRALRDREKVDVVVMIGHQHARDDYAIAHAVRGIDVIFGSHSHLERDLTELPIPMGKTWFISPGQYLANVSRVVLSFDEKGFDMRSEFRPGRPALTGVRGELVPVDDALPENRRIGRRVRRMQRALERDPAYRELFEPVAELQEPIATVDLAKRTLDAMKRATNAEVALSTTSSFRRPLAAGNVTVESLRGSLPYDNEIVVCTMDAVHLSRVLGWNRQHVGTDSEAYLDAPDRKEIDYSRKYRVATTDYLANVAYRDVFICEKEKTGLRVREELQKALACRPPRASLEKRSPQRHRDAERF